MTLDRRLVAGAMCLALFVAACGGSSTATSTPGASSAPAASEPASSEPAESTEPASEPAETQGTASGGPEVSFQPGQAGDLEAMLPDKVGDTAYTKTSFDGASLGVAGVPIDTGALGPILSANGKAVSDVRVAIASPKTPSATNTAMVMAIQVKGMDASKLLPLLNSSGDTYTKGTVGGKSVLRSSSGGYDTVIYFKDDVAFVVFLAPSSVADQIVAALP